MKENQREHDGGILWFRACREEVTGKAPGIAAVTNFVRK
jgi:hypothetical protein